MGYNESRGSHSLITLIRQKIKKRLFNLFIDKNVKGMGLRL